MASTSAQRAIPLDDITPPPLAQGPLGSVGCAVLETSAVGPLWMAWVGEGLAVLRFGREPAPDRELRRAMPELAGACVAAAPLPRIVDDTLTRYFEGEPVDPTTLPVRLRGTPFQLRVWEALRAVARGAVRSYGGLAADVRSPRATRAVGMAMARNPIAVVVPCHRIVGAGSVLGGYSGGLERKRALLALEGVRVEGDRVLLGQLELL